MGLLFILLLFPQLAFTVCTNPTAQISLCRPATGEESWDVPVNQNADTLDAKFHATSGHKHSGAIGDGPTIDARTNELDARNYANLSAAVTAAGSNTRTLVISGTLTQSGALTVPATLTLSFVGAGQLSISSGAVSYQGTTAFWPLRTLVTGAGTLDFVGNRLITEVSPVWWGAVGDGTTDSSAAIQASVNSLKDATTTSGIIKFPRGRFVAANVKFPRGILFEGEGSGTTAYAGTEIIQKTGSNQDIFLSDTTDCPDATEYMHWTQFRHLRLKGDTGGTTGYGIKVTCRIGELFKIEDVFARDFPQSGFLFSGGGTTITLEDISGGGNAQYLIDMDVAPGYSPWQRVTLSRISGDNNGTALINLQDYGNAIEGIHLTDIKGETSQTGKQQTLVRIANLNGIPVYAENLSVYVHPSACGGACTLNEFFLNTSAGSVRLWLRMLRAGGGGTITNLINDQNTLKTLAYSAATNADIIDWQSNRGVIQLVDSSGVQLYHTLGVGPVPTLSACGTSPTISGNDNSGTITIGTATPSACTLTFNIAWPNAVSCYFVDRTTATANPGRPTSVTTTAITWTFAAATVNGDVIDYLCLGR